VNMTTSIIVIMLTVAAYISHYETSISGHKRTFFVCTENPASAGRLNGDHLPEAGVQMGGELPLCRLKPVY